MTHDLHNDVTQHGYPPLPAAPGSAADPRVGKLTPEDAAMLKKLAEAMGALDCMPTWMRDEIEAKTKPPNAKGDSR